MVEPETAAGVGLTIWGTKELLTKLLGPTADYLGGELKSYTEKGVNNVKRIFQKSINKLGEEIDKPGQIPPRVLKGILTEGYFCEDELSAEYFGGVLASSRSGISRDDRGATYINLVSSLSTYQVRTHFILYSIIRQHFLGQNLNPGLATDIRKMKMYMPFSAFLKSMDFQSNEDWFTIFLHSTAGLKRLGLLEPLLYEEVEHMEKRYSGVKFRERGFTFLPTIMGFDLYLWVHGKGNLTCHDFLCRELVLEAPEGITISHEAFSMEEEKRKQRVEKARNET